MKHLPEIHIKIIPHKEQRYDTAGDYWKTRKGNWEIRISEMNPTYELAVLEHELSEMVETVLDGVKWSDIDYFDTKGKGKNMIDPGCSKFAPYHKQHMNAINIEKQVIKNRKLSWKKYDSIFSKLKWQTKKN